MKNVGKSLLRREDPALLRGQIPFAADLTTGTASVAFVRSPVASGRIIDVERPEHGVVFVADDLDDVDPILPLLHRPDYVAVPQSVLATGRVSYVGEPVAVVVADSRAEAEDLAEQVFVDIDVEAGVHDIDAALRPEAPFAHLDSGANVVVEGAMDVGSVDDAFASSAHVVEVDIRSYRQSAMPLEARGAVARFDPADGRVTLYASTQMPHVVRTVIADLLHMPESELRVVTPAVGGGFGQKMALPPEYVVLVWLARRTGRSVSWIEDRRENFTSSFHSRDQRYSVRAAFDETGVLKALDGDLVANVGAFSCYPVTWGVEPLMAMGELPGPYDFQDYRVRARGVATNTCPMAPYRGVSRPVLTLTMERLMDVAAHRVGIDAVEIRRRNLIQSFPYRSATGLAYDEGSYVASLDEAAKVIDVPGFRARQQAAREKGQLLGIGFSVFSERTGYGTPAFAARSMEVTPGYETVDMAMDPSGFVELRIGASPHGQGLTTTLSQIVADELGVDPTFVRVVHGDTDRTPYGWGTFASRSMVICGGATKLASETMARKLCAIAGDLLEAAPEDIVLSGGVASVVGTDRGVGIAEIARIAHHQSHRLAAGMTPGLASTGSYDPAGTFSNACHVAVVEVDRETGGVQILRFLVVEDAGVLVNPMIVNGQIAGGVAQGIANALYEEIVYDTSGNILTTSLLDYLPPTAGEIPTFEIVHLETITDASITGTKGIGEGGTIGAPAAIVNAICDALAHLGVQLYEIPATPQRVRDAIRRAEEAMHER